MRLTPPFVTTVGSLGGCSFVFRSLDAVPIELLARDPALVSQESIRFLLERSGAESRRDLSEVVAGTGLASDKTATHNSLLFLFFFFLPSPSVGPRRWSRDLDRG
jgi:hypothetical protein